MTTTATEIQALYVAYFNRPAEPVGLQFWMDRANANGGTSFVANEFSTSAEYHEIYDGKSPADIVDTIYLNLFGRNAEGFEMIYWGAKLDVTIDIGQFALTILNGAQNADKVAVDNKIVAAELFTAALTTGPQIKGYDGDAANAVAKAWLSTVTTQDSLDAAIGQIDAQIAAVVDAHDNISNAGATFTLTAGVDTITGATANDTINAVIDSVTVANTTYTALDTINGGAGTDTLNILAPAVLDTTGVAGVTVSGVETANFRAGTTVDANTTAWTGLTAANVTQGTNVALTAAATTATSVTGATGTVDIDGGSTQTVTTAGTDVTLGATTVAAGAISVTHTAQAANLIEVDGGTTVNVTASGVTGGAVNIGQGGAATDIASGAITVTSTGAAAVANEGDITLGAITIDGGTTVTVNQTATSSSTAAAAGTVGAVTRIQSAVEVNGGADTTTVAVTQTATVGEVLAVTAVAAKFETEVLTFGAMTVGQTTIVDGLTFTAAKTLTAAEAAAAFANLSADGTQGRAPAEDGIYSGATSGDWTTGAVVTTTLTGSKVTYTAVAAATASAALDIDVLADVVPTDVQTNGLDKVSAITGVFGVTGGAVEVDGAITGTDVLATVTLDGYGASSTIDSDALATLNLANSNADLTITNAAATSLALTLNGVGIVTNTGVIDDASGTYTTINVTTTGADSFVALDAVTATALTVSGTNVLDLTDATLDALETITVSGSAGLTLSADQADTLTAINASATSGAVTVTIDAGEATYQGGSGADTVTLVTTTTPTKAISLGAGDDTLVLASGTTSSTAVLAGGTGTADTLSMETADAETASATTVFATKVTGFEHLTLTAGGTATVDVDVLGGYNYVSTIGQTALTLDGLTSGATLVLTGISTKVITNIVDADTALTDVLNVVVSNTAGVDAGIVEAADVETVNLTVTDTTTTIGTHTLNLKDAALKTVNVTGNAGLTLTLDAADVALTMLNGSAMTGVLTASTNGTVAQTIKGGSAADVLTANHQADVLNGGAGADLLIVNANLVSLTGGAGADTFDVSVATSNANNYATIADFAAGDFILFTNGATAFLATEIDLEDTAVFQDYANEAINTSLAGEISWFQLGGNTFVIENESGLTSFDNGTDVIVKLTGLVDLSTASFSDTGFTVMGV